MEIKVKAGEERIYGSVNNSDIAAALESKYDVEVDRRKIELANPIKMVGEYDIVYKPHPEVPIDLKVVIVPDDEA